jgi:hypothetical protein
MEHIPSRDMEEDEGAVRVLLSASFGEKLEKLRGVGDLEKKKRGKKVTTAPGLSFTEQLESDDSGVESLIGVPKKSMRVEPSEESGDESDVDALLGGEGDGLSGQIDVESEVENFDERLAEGGEASSKPNRSSRAVESTTAVKSSKVVGSIKEKSSKVVGGSKQAEIYPVGSYVAAV